MPNYGKREAATKPLYPLTFDDLLASYNVIQLRIKHSYFNTSAGYDLGLYYSRKLIAEKVVATGFNGTYYTYCNWLYGLQSITIQLQAIQLALQLLFSSGRCGVLNQM